MEGLLGWKTTDFLQGVVTITPESIITNPLPLRIESEIRDFYFLSYKIAVMDHNLWSNRFSTQSNWTNDGSSGYG